MKEKERTPARERERERERAREQGSERERETGRGQLRTPSLSSAVEMNLKDVFEDGQVLPLKLSHFEGDFNHFGIRGLGFRVQDLG